MGGGGRCNSVGQFGRPRKQQSTSPFVPDPTSRNQGLPQFRPQKGECVPEAAREELGHLIVSCGAGAQDFWRRSIGLAAQVHGTFGAGVVFGDRPAPPQAVESCFVAQVPTIFPHLRQSSISPAPIQHRTCARYSIIRQHPKSVGHANSDLRPRSCPTPFRDPGSSTIRATEGRLCVRDYRA